MKTIRVLILEDDLETVSILAKKLSEMENEIFDTGRDIALTVFSESNQVENHVNKLPADYFDVILLDRDCKACGSFHILDIEKFGPDRIISISSTPMWNEEVKARGVERVVLKDFESLEDFAEKVMRELRFLWIQK